MPETYIFTSNDFEVGQFWQSSGDQARANNQPKKLVKFFSLSGFSGIWGTIQKIISEEEKDDLNAADDGEAS